MAAAFAAVGAPAAPNLAASALHPDRTLFCTLGRATNIDPSKVQTTADIKYEGRHSFVLHLPAIPVHQGPAPDPTDAAEPVDPRTRIVSDPANLAAGVPRRFDRVVDLWPKRVEMVTSIEPSLVHLIIVSSIDPVRHTASLYMTRAKDAATMDLNNVYQGDCRVEIRRHG